MKRMLLFSLMLILILGAAVPVAAAPNASIGINVVLNTQVSAKILKDLGTRGRVLDVIYEINALTMKIKTSQLAEIKALPYVAAANPDAVRQGAPIDKVPAENFLDGISTWNLDSINVMDIDSDNNAYRQVEYDGTGVYVAVLDTGLMDSWRRYFPEERIAEEYAISFGGGGGEPATVSIQPNKWEHDQNGHGTHVTSTILGYSLRGTPVNGVAPMVTIIPVKVLNQNGSGWSSVIARGIQYIGELKAGPLADFPVIINMSLGGSALDAIEQKAIDEAIDQGVIIVASAGNRGEEGMGYPGAYEPVISVAAYGWADEWTAANWWNSIDVAEPTNPEHFYITEFSSRELVGQDLDVAAPGSWIVGPYQLNSGMTNSYYFLGGTSMASPHVAGIVALMAEKYPALTATEAEYILEGSAIPFETDDWGDDDTGACLVDAAAALLDTTP